MPRDSSPPGNTGGNLLPITVDWMSVVFSSSVVQPGPGLVASVRELMDETVTEFRAGRGVHGYEFSAHSTVGNVCIAWGGNRDTVYVDVPGDACARMRSWHEAQAFVEDRRGWLTRVDLALDCLQGEHPIEEVVDRYRAGEFKGAAGGRNPRINCAGNWIEPDKFGRTLYIGRRENGKQLCVYEKGKQLYPEAQPPSPWVRWEARFGNVDRVLPPDMLIRPREYFAAAYPALEFVDQASVARIPVRKAQERLSVADLTNHASSSYGGLVDFLARRMGIAAQDLVGTLSRDRVPRRLSTPTVDELAERANWKLVMEVA